MAQRYFSSRLWKAFLGHVAAADHCLLMFDFDGTLAGIRARPSQARMDPALRRSLAALGRLPQTRLAVVSGRGLEDLRRRVAMPGVALASNHGLRSSVKGLGPSRARLRRWMTQADRAADRLWPLCDRFPGLMLEHKGPDLSLHTRGVALLRIPALGRALALALKGLGMRVRPGLKLFEIRPKGCPHKGDAALALAGKFAPRGACFFVGDDRTDEDAFRALRRLGSRALTVKVGKGKTAAQLRLSRGQLVGMLAALHKARLQGGA